MQIVAAGEYDIAALVLSEEQSNPRTAGVHVSSVIRHISKTIGRHKGDFTEDDLGKFALLGRLWEAMLARAAFPEPRYVRPGELECDGIIGSPDAIDVEREAIHEFKVTWKSCNRDIREFREYWWQIMSYCYMARMARAELIVLYICGNWKPPIPRAMRYSVTFTPSELLSNWDMICNNAKEMLCQS